MVTPFQQQNVLQAWRNEDFEAFTKALLATEVNVNHLYREEGFSTILEVISSDCKTNCGDFIRAAVKHGAQVNLRNSVHGGRTALLVASQSINPTAIEALLESGASVTSSDDKGNNCLHLIARKVTANAEERQMLCLDLLLETPGVPLNEFNEQGQTPILTACKRGAWKVVERLLMEDSRLDIDSKSDKKDLEKSAREEITERRPDLIPKLPPPYNPDQSCTAINGEKLFQLLYDKFENRFCAEFTKQLTGNREQYQLLNYHDDYNSFLQFAVANKFYKAAKVLLMLGADVNYDKPRGLKPLHLACESGDPTMLRILLDHEVDLKDDSGQTALHLLAKLNEFTEGHAECFKKLLAKKHKDINSVDYFGKTPLHYAAEFPNTTSLTLLLEAGANIFAQDFSGQPAFFGIPETVLETYLDSKVSWNGLRCQDCKLLIDVDFLRPLTRGKKGKTPLLTNHFTNEPEMNGLFQLSNTSHLKHFISHPVITSFITHKWSLIRPFYYLELLLYSIFYFLFTFYVYITTTEYVHEHSLVITIKVFLVIFLILRYMQSLLAAAATPYGFAKNPQRWVNAIFTIIATIVLSKDVSSGFDPDSPWIRLFPIFTCSALLSSAVQFVLLLSEHHCLALTFSIVFAIVRRCVIVFCSYFSLILTFKVIFLVLNQYYCHSNCKTISMFFIPFPIPMNTSADGIHVEENSAVMFTFLSIIITAMVVQTFALAVVDCQKLCSNSQQSTLQQQIKLIASLEETLISSPRNRWRHLTKYLSKDINPPAGYMRLSKAILFFSKRNTNLVVYPNRDTTLTTAVVKSKPQAWWNARARLKPKTIMDLEKKISFEREAPEEEHNEDKNDKKVDTLLEGVRQVSTRLESMEETGRQTERLLIQSLAIASLQNEKQ